MEIEQWERIKELFDRTLPLAPGERAAFLAREAPDESLRRRVETLLAAHDDDPGFLEDGVGMRATAILAGTPDPMIGRQAGPYRILEEIARGGMGTVYLAERTDAFRKRFALKIVKRGMDTDEVIRRFQYERQVLASLEHPHIARIVDGGATDDGLPYLVMDYIEGQAIDEYCTARKLSIEERLRLFLAVCDAVSYAHRSLVVHRDLKPSNIVVNTDGEPVLLDFGIAKVLDARIGGVTVANTVAGFVPMTPEYASPEQLLGEPVTTASDVYSLGAILYELLTGVRLWKVDGVTPEALEERAKREAPLPSSVVDSAEVRRLRGDLDTIVARALEHEPARRFASVDEMAADIRRHLEGRPITARPSHWAYRAGKFVRRHRLGVGVAVVLLVVLTGASAMTLQQKRVAERQRKIATDAARRMVLVVADAMTRMSGPTEARLRLLDQARTIFWAFTSYHSSSYPGPTGTWVGVAPPAGEPWLSTPSRLAVTGVLGWLPSSPAKWQATLCRGPICSNGGSTLAQISWAIGQRVRNRQPDGGLIGLGTSPVRRIRSRRPPTEACFTSGTAESRACV